MTESVDPEDNADGTSPATPGRGPHQADAAPEGPETVEPVQSGEESTRATDPGAAPASDLRLSDLEATVNLTGNDGHLGGDAQLAEDFSRNHLKGLLEALIFASDSPIKPGDLARAASAPVKQVKELLLELKKEYVPRGVQLDEVAGGWVFRTSMVFAPFVRDLTKHKPVRLTRAQVETLAIIAYRQPVTRPEVDDIRGVDSGPVLKLLLERDLVKILGKKDEPGRPIIYGTTATFLEFFGLKSLKDLPTLKEFTELSEDSRRTVEKELGDVLDGSQPAEAVSLPATDDTHHDTLAPPGEATPADGVDHASEERD